MIETKKLGRSGTILYNHERKVKCVSCTKEVNANLITYADGYIAICPLCGKLAYVGK